MRVITIVALTVLPSIALAQTLDRTFRDGMGRMTGTATTSGNVTTFRDRMGRESGTAERLPDGRILLRDRMGRETGTVDPARR